MSPRSALRSILRSASRSVLVAAPVRVAVPVAALLPALVAPSPAHASPHGNSPSARTTDAGQLEIGALSSTTYAVTERVELGAHPVGLVVFPAARVKINWWQGGSLHCDGSDLQFSPFAWFASEHRFFVPTPLLNALAREGSGGLLPSETEVPFAVGMTNSAIATREVAGHLATLRLGITFALGHSSELPLVEFPFLYSTLASLYSPVVLHAGFAIEGTIAGPLDYELSPKLHLFRPDADLPWPGEVTPWVYSLEPKGWLHLRAGTRHRFSLGAALSIARFPIGVRAFWSPILDYRLAFR